ncbi:hypothetical protein MRB53_038922 [Persea americana]|nr:hypothetical protein MRB53_038922 [Persea americana]
MSSGLVRPNFSWRLKCILTLWHRSFKDTAKALHRVFTLDPAPQGIPQDVQESIESFFLKHEEIRTHDTQRIHEELQGIYKEYVASNRAKIGLFLQVLCLVRPAILDKSRLEEWWTVAMRDAVTHSDALDLEIKSATDFMMRVLDFDKDGDQAVSASQAHISKHFTGLLLKSYIKSTQDIKDDSNAESTRENARAARCLEELAVRLGERKPEVRNNALVQGLADEPQILLPTLNLFIVDKSTRLQAFRLLGSLLLKSPPHLGNVAGPIFENILKCLMIDTCFTSISLALVVLIMFMPHLPALMTMAQKTSEKKLNVRQRKTPSWPKLSSPLDTPDKMPDLRPLFTFLYGLYPINFTIFIRNARKYLKSVDFPRADELDADKACIQKYSEHFRRAAYAAPPLLDSVRCRRGTIEQALGQS